MTLTASINLIIAGICIITFIVFNLVLIKRLTKDAEETTKAIISEWKADLREMMRSLLEDENVTKQTAEMVYEMLAGDDDVAAMDISIMAMDIIDDFSGLADLEEISENLTLENLIDHRRKGSSGPRFDKKIEEMIDEIGLQELEDPFIPDERLDYLMDVSIMGSELERRAVGMAAQRHPYKKE